MSESAQQTAEKALAQNNQQARQIRVVEDHGEFANLMDTARFEHLYRVANMFAQSTIIPDHFRNNAGNCFIAVQMATRLGVDPFMFMQKTYVVHGKPGMEAQLAIALMNSSGLFTGPLEYEIVGTDPHKPDYKVRAFATRKSTGKVILGPWVDWATVKGEKWDAKEGSKWKTMPGMMFLYRSATFFGRVYCPERLMGMETNDELEDRTLVATVMNLREQARGDATMPTKREALAPTAGASASAGGVPTSSGSPLNDKAGGEAAKAVPSKLVEGVAPQNANASSPAQTSGNGPAANAGAGTGPGPVTAGEGGDQASPPLQDRSHETSKGVQEAEANPEIEAQADEAARQEINDIRNHLQGLRTARPGTARGELKKMMDVSMSVVGIEFLVDAPEPKIRELMKHFTRARLMAGK